MFLTALLAQFQTEASAKVTRLEVLSKAPYGTFKPGQYVRWDVRMVGELSPTTETIPDLRRAVRNERGTVDYATRVTLIMLAEPGRGNGSLLIDVPNRGRAISLSLYNSPRNSVIPLGSFDHGTGFLQDAGYSLLVVPWELGQGTELPSVVEYDGKRLYIEATALAVVRDVADFFASSTADSVGTPNPLMGAVNRTIAIGYSQSGRFLRSFLLHGFNSAEGRRVFSGMHILGAASGYILLRLNQGPESGAGAATTFAEPDVRGINEEPIAISEIVERISKRGENPPRLMFINTTTDYFSLRASLGRTGAVGSSDQPIPPNVRIYDMAGASHALIRGQSQCKLPYAIMDWHPIMRSTLAILDRWVSTEVLPPPSELMPLQISGDDPTVLRAPNHLPSSLVLIPVRDQDGHPTGGIRLPDVAVPIGSHGGQNAPLSFICALASSYVPFAKTKDEREAANDARLSLAERYRDRNDYVDRVRVVTRELEKRGFLLSEDADVIVNAAVQTPPL